MSRPGGEIDATCVEGVCESNTCATSAQCGIEQFCDDGTCMPGCQNDNDCYPDATCNTEDAVCEEAPCVSSQIDCAFQEFCNNATGECVPASGYYCRECEVDDDCGGNGNVCVGWGAEREYCGVTCEFTRDCPSGYDCYDVGIDTDGDGTADGTTRQCLTACWLYIQD